jgi:hypothetical protein
MRWAARVVLTPVLLFLGLMVSWFGASALDALWDWLGERSHPRPDEILRETAAESFGTPFPYLPEPAPQCEALAWHRRVWRWLTAPDGLTTEERVW